jgi:hypothetical protein
MGHRSIAEFREFETETNAFEMEIEGVRIWEHVRVPVWRAFRANSARSGSGFKPSYCDYMSGSYKLFRNLFFRNPYLAKQSDLAFFGSARRKLIDGLWEDIYTDLLCRSMDYDYVQFEHPFKLKHSTPAATDNLRYLDLIKYGGTFQRVLGMKEPTVSPPELGRVKAMQDLLRERYDCNFDILNEIRKRLHAHKTTHWMYQMLLRKIEPKLVILVCSYGQETLIDVCNELSIPVAELQHGIIADDHAGYHYPEEHPKKYFPDYLLIHGDFWRNAAQIPLPDERIITVGYPWLEQGIKRYQTESGAEQILIVPNQSTTEILSHFAVGCAENPQITDDIVLKLHPSRLDGWKKKYPWLLNSEVTVIDGQSPSLYELFAQSRAQVGVGSTAVYEGLCFDLETYVYDVEGASRLMPLVEAGAARRIDSVDALAAQLGRGADTFDREHYFAADALAAMQETLKRLMATGTVYERA